MRKIVLTQDEIMRAQQWKLKRKTLLRAAEIIKLLPRGITFDEMKRLFIAHVFEQNGGVRTATAQELDMSYNTLRAYINDEDLA